MEVVVLPSPTPGLDTAMTVKAWVLCRCSTTWRRARYCSASRPDGATRLTRWLSTSPVMVAPRRGAPAARRRGALGAGAGPLPGAEGEVCGFSGIGGGGAGGAAGAAEGTWETGGGAWDTGGAAGAAAWSRSARSRCACSRAFENLLIVESWREPSEPG